MWHQLGTTVARSLILNLENLPKKYPYEQTQKFYAALRNTGVSAAPLRESEPGNEYIVPYNPECEKREPAYKLVDILRNRLQISKDDVTRIMNSEIVFKAFREKSLVHTIELLVSEGVNKQNFIDYPWLITLDKKRCAEKIELLKSLNGFRDINDFVPLLRLQFPKLQSLVASLNGEASDVDYGNRVYYIAEKLNLSPTIITKYLATRLFVLQMPLEKFKANLQHMIDYNVEPINILKDLWGFRYTPRGVEKRLKRALHAKKGKIMPWMVKCPEPILEKSLQLSLDELNVLGDKTTVAEYVGERLGFSAKEAQAIMDKHPRVHSVRVTKIKEVLDYLLNDVKFTRYDVAQAPRILCHSLETTKQRIEELAKHGFRPYSLVLVCLSKREYEKFLQQFQQNRSENVTEKHDINIKNE